MWTPECEAEFIQIKAVLTDERFLKAFDPNLYTELLVDTSMVAGAGYILIQRTQAGMVTSSGVVAWQLKYVRHSLLQFRLRQQVLAMRWIIAVTIQKDQGMTGSQTRSIGLKHKPKDRNTISSFYQSLNRQKSGRLIENKT